MNQAVLARWTGISLPAVLVVASLPVAGCTSGTDGTGASVPKALSADSPMVTGYVALPSLDRAIDGFVALAEELLPGVISKERVKEQIGALLGDPTLEYLDTTRPIVLVLLSGTPPGPPPWAILASVKEGAPYGQMVTAMEMQAKQDGGLLMVAGAAEVLEQDATLRAVYDRVRGAEIGETARLYLDTGRLLDAYGPLVDAQISAMEQLLPAGRAEAPGGVDFASMVEILKLEVMGLKKLLSLVAEVQLGLEVGGQGVRCDTILVAKQGSSLARCFARSARLRPEFPALEQKGFVEATYAIDPQGISDVMKDVLDDISRDPTGARFVSSELTSLLTNMAGWWTGTAATSVDLAGGTDVEFEFVMGVKDEQKFLEMMEQSVALYQPGSPFHEVYQQLGMDYSSKLERNVREHAGVAVHRLSVSVKADPQKLGPAAALASMDMTGEMAVVAGRAVMSHDAAGLDRLVDSARSGGAGEEFALASRKAFGAGRHAYVVYDVFGLLRDLAQSMPEGLGKTMFQGVVGAISSNVPLVGAVTFQENRARLEGKLPVEFLKEFAKLVPLMGGAGSPLPPEPPK